MTSSSCLLLLRRSFRFHDLARACFASLVLPWCGRVERDPWTHVQDGHGWRWQRRGRAVSGGTWGWRRCDSAAMDDGWWMSRTTLDPTGTCHPFHLFLSFFPSLSFFLSFFLVVGCWDGDGWRGSHRKKERKKVKKGDGWVHTGRWEGRILPQGRREGIHPRWMGASTTDLDGSRQRPQTPLWIERERKDTATVPSPIHVGGGGVDLHPTLSRSTPWTQERVTTDRWKHPAIPGPTGTMHIPTPSIVQEDIARKKKQRDGDDNTTQINNEQSTTSDTSTWQDRPWLWRNANQTKPNHQTKIQAP